MATKVEDLKITKVDFVDRGANQAAHVMLFKRDSDGDGNGSQPEVDNTQSTEGKILKRFISAIGKMVGAKPEDIEAAVKEVMKSDPEEKLGENQVTQNATHGSTDPEAQESVAKNVTGEPKGEEEMIDVSKMTPSERAFYEDLKKRYSVEAPEAGTAEHTEKSDPLAGTTADTGKGEATKVEQSGTAVEKSASADDPYAGLHPVVRAELEMLKKRADEADTKELTEIAKKYEIIGKKPEELVPVLKSLKAAGGTAYTDMLTVLDASVEAVNKSAMFSEIGKSASYPGGGAAGAWGRIEKKADELMTADPKLTKHQAIDLACQQNPSLVHDYENEM